MVKLYMSDVARQNAIDEITRQIDAVGKIKSDELSYTNYRAIVKSLSDLRAVIKNEMDNKGAE